MKPSRQQRIRIPKAGFDPGRDNPALQTAEELFLPVHPCDQCHVGIVERRYLRQGVARQIGKLARAGKCQAERGDQPIEDGGFRFGGLYAEFIEDVAGDEVQFGRLAD
jgi:hypothetical protein